MDEAEIFESFDDVVCEMSTDAGGMVPLSADLVARVTAGDPEPQFATFVIESGWSKSNRFWGPELFGKVAAEMQSAANGDPIVGYMGHIKDEDDPFVFPEIQLQWLGAKLTNSGDKARLAVKAYVLPGTKGRDYLKRGLVKAVSWRGKVAQEMYQKGVRIKDFRIESIDLSRPRAAGMSARMVGTLTSEMENEGGRTVKPDEIQALQENELRAHNPALVTAIEVAARTPVETKVGEMEAAAATVQPALDLIPRLREILGLDAQADDVSVIQAAVTQLTNAGKSLRDSVLAKVIGEKLKVEADDVAGVRNRALVTRIIAGEMQNVKLTGNEKDDEKTVGEMVDTFIDSTPELKVIVSEMQNTPPNLAGTQDDDKQGEYQVGKSTANITVKARA